MTEDSFNLYCLDCKSNQSRYCSLTFGVFLCKDCAMNHKKLLGRERSFIKNVGTDKWDDFQVRFLQIGGNKAFMNFLALYGLENESNIRIKYLNKAAQYYSLKLRAKCDGKKFDLDAPTTNGSHMWKDEARLFAEKPPTFTEKI